MANTYLQRTTSTPTSDKKGTISFWIKRSKLSSDQHMANIYVDASNRFMIKFQSDNSFVLYNQNSGTGNMYLESSQKFRDVSAFYHVVCKIDTTQVTAANRAKVYINGSEMSYAVSTYPNQDDTIQWFQASKNQQFGQYNSSNYLDAVMSHVHYTDGYAYDASTFGSTDSTTGEWKINTSPSITMGNNGFTILKDGNTITDQSSNSNNFALGAGTLTKTEDCPDNVFACINGIAQGTYNLTLTTGNNTVYCTDNAWRSAFSTFALSSGKYYFEVKRVGSSANMSVGIVDQSQLSGTVGTDKLQTQTRGYAYLASGQKGNSGSETSWGNAYAQNDIVGCAIDLDNGKIYFSKNGAWENSGDPTSGSTGTGSMYNLTSGYDYLIGTSLYSTSAGASFNFGNGYYGTTAVTTNSGNGYAGAEGKSIFSYQPPTNYSALNTRGLNE